MVEVISDPCHITEKLPLELPFSRVDQARSLYYHIEDYLNDRPEVLVWFQLLQVVRKAGKAKKNLDSKCEVSHLQFVYRGVTNLVVLIIVPDKILHRTL